MFEIWVECNSSKSKEASIWKPCLLRKQIRTNMLYVYKAATILIFLHDALPPFQTPT